jgi:PAS domain S-box-containing protein
MRQAAKRNLRRERQMKKAIKARLEIQQAGSILESISDGVFTVNTRWEITYFNQAAEKITGISRDEALGKPCAEVFRANMCEADCALRQTLRTGRPVIDRNGFIVRADGRRVPISISTALLRDASGRVIGGAETFRDLSLIEELRKELGGRFQIGDIFTQSHAMRRLFEMLPTVAASDSTVLIQGETGTGKELLARALHFQSARRDQPFVALNCAALPDSLLESELFGYQAGAFTGAQKDKPGKFALAKAGTLFLDEIGDISPALQVRLLRVLQERIFEPLGATHSCRLQARIVAATNKDLSAQVKSGAFRQDLFYRIHVLKLELPPLRQRKEDIPLLAEHFLARMHARQGKDVRGLRPDALALLMAHDFPGNIRELENILEYAVAVCAGHWIEARHLPENVTAMAAPAVLPNRKITKTVKTLEAQLIQQALERNANNRLAAARELGMHKSTFFRKVKALGLKLPSAAKKNS